MKILALKLIKAYKRWLSPVIPPSCRFLPTCSQYAYDAIDRFGLIKGGLLAVKRITRCNPFCPGGYDPVPAQWPGTATKELGEK